MSQIPLSERVITIEEVFELSPLLPDVVAMQTRDANLQGEGEIPLRRLIKEALRMRPSRIIVGEVREAEAMDLLIALNSGLPGMGTIHANSVRGALLKLQTLPLLTGENIPERFILSAISAAIDLIVQLKIDPSGKRRITEVGAISGRFESGNLELEKIYNWSQRNEETGSGINELGIAAIAERKPEKFPGNSSLRKVSNLAPTNLNNSSQEKVSR
jgi:pilus assembly protein CpaF